MQKAFIETQFPIARLSAETLKERNAGAGQTLTGLGKWWGRKQLIHVRATIVGALMPASTNPKKDREIFLKILTMDDEGTWNRQNGKIAARAWREAAPIDIQQKYFGASSFLRGITDEQKEFIRAEIWEGLEDAQRLFLNSERKRKISDRSVFDAKTYSERITHCERPESSEGPSLKAWEEINQHLETHATNLPELIKELGERAFGRVPKVGDAFCGGGSIPFEAARIGCDAYGSDLNPVAGMLTWASLYLIGGGEKAHDEARAAHEATFKAADKQISDWEIEHNDQGERADAYLYCVEVKPEGCDYYIPLAPSWVISEKFRIVALWSRIEGSDRLQPIVNALDPEEFRLYKNGKGATVVNSRVVDPFNSNRSWSIEAIRGSLGLRRWSNEDVTPRPEDVFQERLYCIRWINSRGERRYTAPNEADLIREKRVLSLLQKNFATWQQAGYLPSKRIPEGGDKTEEPIRTRGWTHWHHLFTPRQLLAYGNYLSKADSNLSTAASVSLCLKMATQTNWNSRLNIWNSNLGKGGGVGYSEQTFSNQALNCLYNYGTRSFGCLSESLMADRPSVSLASRISSLQICDARDITEECDIWITDPPYADAINYHELGDFFLAWYDRNFESLFPGVAPDSRAELAVKGDGDDFKRSMVEIYSNLARKMPDNGLQVVMFTHQDLAVWADLGMILWAAGLKVTAAWTISTERSAGIRKGNYVQGTVCLVLRKRIAVEPGFLFDVYPLVEDEVRSQISTMQALDENSEPNFNDADYQLAAYAAALKVLTQYSSLDGKNVAEEVFAVRSKNEKSDFEQVIERAITIACDELIR